MNDVRVDRLILRLSGLTEEEGRRLAMLVSEGLAAADIPSFDAETLGPLRLSPRAPSGDPSKLDALATHIVRDIVQQLSRST